MAGSSTFITGGFGFLGQHIVKAVRDHDPVRELRVLVRTPRRTLLGIESMPGVRLVSGELSRPETFAAALDGVDTVIHCAALVSFRRADREALRRSNIVGTENLLRAALDRRCRDFVFISSVSAVGQAPGRLSDETMVPDLEEKRHTDFYGYSKLVGERALQAQTDRLRVVILNPSVVLGPGSLLLGRISSLLRRLPLLPMLTTLISLVDVRDVARAAVLALSRGRSGERYIVTTDSVDLLAFARMVMAELGRSVPVFPVPRGLLAFGDTLRETARRAAPQSGHAQTPRPRCRQGLRHRKDPSGDGLGTGLFPGTVAARHVLDPPHRQRLTRRSSTVAESAGPGEREQCPTAAQVPVLEHPAAHGAALALVLARVGPACPWSMKANTIWQMRRPACSRMGRRLALNSSRVIVPSKPGSTQPAFWMNRPMRPMELRPSTKAVTLAGQADELHRGGEQERVRRKDDLVLLDVT